MYQTILVEMKNHIAILTLNRPDKLNAINLQMKRELNQALSELEADSDVRVVIMTGLIPSPLGRSSPTLKRRRSYLTLISLR